MIILSFIPFILDFGTLIILIKFILGAIINIMPLQLASIANVIIWRLSLIAAVHCWPAGHVTTSTSAHVVT